MGRAEEDESATRRGVRTGAILPFGVKGLKGRGPEWECDPVIGKGRQGAESMGGIRPTCTS